MAEAVAEIQPTTFFYVARRGRLDDRLGHGRAVNHLVEGMGNGAPPAAACANASRHARVTSSRAASQTTASPLMGWNLPVPDSRVRRSSEEAPATCVIPSSRTEPFDPNT